MNYAVLDCRIHDFTRIHYATVYVIYYIYLHDTDTRLYCNRPKGLRKPCAEHVMKDHFGVHCRGVVGFTSCSSQGFGLRVFWV